MSSLKKTIIIDGKEHFISIESSLDLNEVEITATDPISNRIIHISLSSLLKPHLEQNLQPNSTYQLQNNLTQTQVQDIYQEDQNKVLNDIFG